MNFRLRVVGFCLLIFGQMVASSGFVYATETNDKSDAIFTYTFRNNNKILYKFSKYGTKQVQFYSDVTKKIEVITAGTVSRITIGSSTQLPVGEPSKRKINVDDVEIKPSPADLEWVPFVVGDSIFLVNADGIYTSVSADFTEISWSDTWHVKAGLVKNDQKFSLIINEKSHKSVVLLFAQTPDGDRFAGGWEINRDPAIPFSVDTILTQLKNEIENKAARQVEPDESKKVANSAFGPNASEGVREAHPDQFDSMGFRKPDLAKIDLEQYISGQPEVIERLHAMAVKKSLYGETEKPEVILLMGSPGTGKDTAAESYVDAIYGYKGANHDHLYRLPILRDKAELWGLLGSTTGHIGSDKLMPFHRWLVEHSGGKYKIKREKGPNGNVTAEYIVKNPEWQGPGTVLPGYESPLKAVIYVNEFHDWDKEVKNIFLKQAMEKGYFQVNNPGSGENQLYVPVTFIVATNEGLGLVTSRELNGQRYGKPLTYEQMVEKWDMVHGNVPLLREQLLKTNGQVNGSNAGKGSPGISEELLNRFPDSAFCLMRPLSPADLQKISRLKMEDLRKRFSGMKKPGASGVQLHWTDHVIEFLQAYHYVAEENARPMEHKVTNLIEDTILKAVAQNKLNLSGTKHVNLDVIQNADRTYSLIVAKDSGAPQQLLIESTTSEREARRMSEVELAKILSIGERLKKHVFGVDKVIEKLSQSIVDSEEGRHGRIDAENATQPARSFMFLGLSSTGKTETAKAIGREYYGSEDSVVFINCTELRSIDDVKDKVLGRRDHLGNPISSEYMKAFDRTNGRVIVVFDEAANAPREVLKALYDVIREPVVRTFADGKPRVMSNVFNIITGNAGEEWYADIPQDIPEIEQQNAMQEVYENAMKEPGFRRMTLQKYFSEALINRFGEQNIFFFAPLGFKTIRELTQHKVMQTLKKLQPSEGRWGWNVVFANSEEYLKTLNLIEQEGFILREQGASIDRFVRQEFEAKLRGLLRDNLVRIGSTVVISTEPAPATKELARKQKEIKLKVEVEGRGPLFLEVQKRETPVEMRSQSVDQVITAYHEAGHELTRHVLFKDKFKSKLISIVPGVTEIMSRWVRYLGIAEYEQEEQFSYTRAAIIRLMAVSAAGFEAQKIVTKGEIHDSGKRNDMERATLLAKRAILQFGLSEKFGRESAPENANLDEYVKTFSEDKRKLYEEEVQALINEACEMARNVLLTNQDVLSKMAVTLAEKGKVEEDDLEKFYVEHKVEIKYNAFAGTAQKLKNKVADVACKIAGCFKGDRNDIVVELKTNVPRPTAVADITEIVAKRKADQVSQVPLPEKLPVAAATTKTSTPAHVDCNGLLTTPHVAAKL